ncbi:hypothetical protein KUTeg_008267 [Tegillarca granosa]|uniref:Chitin-binding type-2 domain-containing protein n=1 Tax=Tegillarca granosa TaxID=220873 RepID=A0ABQ9FBW1_TEGGR|nr:hypothetical protein KUTeg_008267 [Tegillarca granosa]
MKKIKEFILISILSFVSRIYAQGGTMTKVENKILPETCKALCGDKSACLTPLEGDCRYYNDCFKQSGVWYGFVRQCSFGLHYNNATGVCDYVRSANCVSDRCKLFPETKVYSNANPYYFPKCDGAYWECKNGISEGHCCPETQVFVEGQGCVEQKGCVNECQATDAERCGREGAGHQFQKVNAYCGEYYECNANSPGQSDKLCCESGFEFVFQKGCVKNENCSDPCGYTAKKLACNIEKIDDYTYKYINNQRVVSCPPGTRLGSNGEGCYVCEYDTSKPGTRCKQTVFMNFNRTMSRWASTMDNWGAQAAWVGTVGLLPNARKGIINISSRDGRPRYLTIPTYNARDMDEVYMEIRFKPTAQKETSTNPTLISNCRSDTVTGKLFSPSFHVELTPTSIKVMAININDEVAIVEVPYTSDVFNNLTIHYDDVQLEVINTPEGGQEIKRTAPLTGGREQHTAIKIWTCKPTPPKASGPKKPIPANNPLSTDPAANPSNTDPAVNPPNTDPTNNPNPDPVVNP